MARYKKRDEKSRENSKDNSFLQKFLRYLIYGFILLAVFSSMVFVYYDSTLPSVHDIDKNAPKITFYDDNNKIIPTNRFLHSEYISYSEIPQDLINALLSTEDRTFFTHSGFDISSIIRAFFVNWHAGYIKQGGSTITQQLVKISFLSPEKTIKRKVQEILLAKKIESVYSKEQILTFYLNRVYFGSGNYGVKQAARFYFKKDISKITLKESAMLVGLLKAPSKYSPIKNPELSEQRTKQVLSNMVAEGFISEEDLKKSDSDKKEVFSQNSVANQNMFFIDWLEKDAKTYINKKHHDKYLKVKTTLQNKVQEVIVTEMDKIIAANKDKIGKSQISVIAMSHDGKIVGLVGGKSYTDSQFNRAIFAKRQPGSAFKLFVYLAAIRNGLKPDDIFYDLPVKVGNWEPENYNKEYHGIVTLREGFAQSMNSVAIQAGKEVGNQAIVDMVKSLGISTRIDEEDSSIALGTHEMTLLDLVSAYNVVANGGNYVQPFAIGEISIQNGKQKGEVLYNRQGSAIDPVLNEDEVKMIKDLMAAVVNYGTGRNAHIKDMQIYGKTGTSQDYRDAWFIGFNDKYTMGVWVGNDDNTATKGIAGGSIPALLFKNIIKSL